MIEHFFLLKKKSVFDMHPLPEKKETKNHPNPKKKNKIKCCLGGY
jgi:hypothetical protein